MYKNIIIATDGSDLAAKAVRQGLGLAKSLGAKATAVTITEPWTAVVAGEMGVAFPIDEYDNACKENARCTLAAATAIAEELGVPCAMHHAKDTFPADGIVETAKSLGADLIVMSSHGRRGVSRLLLGSQATKVVTHSTIPVLIVR